MSTKREEEKNEKIVRGLLKLPPNRRCINCDNLGPQYVCTNFWTFVCITCSGIHREFTHRVKSVSMSKFTTQEVDALQRGGNQRAREQFLREWDVQQMRLPNNNNPDKIREFIKTVYVDKKYCGSRIADKPPRDKQNLKGEEDYKRASSYHSFSQSPPYDHQYEERRYGKQAGMLTRKPGSDRGIEGKLSSFFYSPDREGEQKYENKFTNDNIGSKKSDYSASSDPFRSSHESSNFRAYGIASPPSQAGVASPPSQVGVASPPSQVGVASPPSQIGVAMEDSNKFSHAHRSASSGSFGSFDSNSCSSKSTNPGGLIDSVLEAAPACAADATKIDLFNQVPVPTQNTLLAPSVDFFTDFNHLSLTKSSIEQKPPVTAADTGGWANFDLSHQVKPASQTASLPHTALKDDPKKTADLFSSVGNNVDLFLMQSSKSQLTRDQWSTGHEEGISATASNTQMWNAFSGPISSPTQPLPAFIPQNNDSRDMLHGLPAYVDPYTGLKSPEVTHNDGFFIPSVDEKVPSPAAAVAGMASSSFFPTMVPQMGGVSLERKASLNPFDFSVDLEPEVNNVYLDMSSLQSTLPDQQLPSFPDSSPDLWFQQDSFASFITPAHQGGLTYIGGQAPREEPSQQLQNMPSQGPIAPVSGNPFA